VTFFARKAPLRKDIKKNTGRMRLADPSNKNPVSFVLWPHHTILPHTPFLSPVFLTVQ